MQKNLVTLIFSAVFGIALLFVTAIVAPAKTGYIRYLDKFEIERGYSATISGDGAYESAVDVSTKPDEAGSLFATYSTDSKSAYFTISPFLGESSGNMTLSSSSTLDQAKAPNDLSLVMMLFELKSNNMVISATGDHSMRLVKKALSTQDYAFSNSCISIKSNQLEEGQRIIRANLNCDLSLAAIMGIVTQNDEFATKHTSLSEQYFMNVGSYVKIWNKFGATQAQSLQEKGLAFTKGSDLYISFVNKPTALDKGINILYKSQ